MRCAPRWASQFFGSNEFMESRHSHLTGEQTAALRHLCAARGGLTLIPGMAGTGKSTLFAMANEVGTQQGLSVHGAALSGKAAQGLAEAAGISSTTLHRLLRQLSRGNKALNDHPAVVLDEASMSGTRQLAQIVKHGSRAEAALVLCGDLRQLQAIWRWMKPFLSERNAASTRHAPWLPRIP